MRVCVRVRVWFRRSNNITFILLIFVLGYLVCCSLSCCSISNEVWANSFRSRSLVFWTSNEKYDIEHIHTHTYTDTYTHFMNNKTNKMNEKS